MTPAIIIIMGLFEALGSVINNIISLSFDNIQSDLDALADRTNKRLADLQRALRGVNAEAEKGGDGGVGEFVGDLFGDAE